MYKERRSKIYSNKRLHQKLKEQDRERKNESNRKAAEKRKGDENERVLYRLKQKEAKRNYRAKQKELKRLQGTTTSDVSFSTPQKSAVKNKMRKLRRSYENKLLNVSKEKSNSNENNFESTNSKISDSPILVSASLWKCLSPNQKKRVKTKLVHDGVPEGLNRKMRNELGINLSNTNVELPSNEFTELQQLIRQFFFRDDVSRVCPDTKRMKKNPANPDEILPVRYRLCSLKSLYEKFKAENMQECSFSYFTQNCPFNVFKPNPNDWGTCLCSTCLNPEIKLEELSKVTKRTDIKWNDTMDYKNISEIIEKVKSINYDSSITFAEWQKVVPTGGKKRKNKKIVKVSRKMLLTLSFQKFKKRLLDELNFMYEHKARVYSQYKAFKLAREEAQSNPNTITIQLDWSENAKMRQSREEKSAYYHEDSVCLHPMYIWSKENCHSRCAISDCTDHKAPAVMTSIKPILDDILAKTDVTKINIISDSPTSQYRNRTMCWLLHSYCAENFVEIKWIWLESGHGKGIPDGIGATVKKAIKDILSFNPDNPVYTVNDLLQRDLQESVPSILLNVYTEEQVQQLKSSLPIIEEVKDISKAHEIYFSFQDGSLVTEMKETSLGCARKIKISATTKNKAVKTLSKASVPESSEESDNNCIFSKNPMLVEGIFLVH